MRFSVCVGIEVVLESYGGWIYLLSNIGKLVVGCLNSLGLLRRGHSLGGMLGLDCLDGIYVKELYNCARD